MPIDANRGVAVLAGGSRSEVGADGLANNGGSGTDQRPHFITIGEMIAEHERDPIKRAALQRARARLYDTFRAIGCLPSQRLRQAKAAEIRRLRGLG